MRVKANCRINHDGVWYSCGDEFELTNKEIKSLGRNVTVIETEEKPKRKKKD